MTSKHGHLDWNACLRLQMTRANGIKFSNIRTRQEMGGAATKPVQPVHLTLIPDESARTLSGFADGKPLRLTGSSGETVGALLDRLNTYRGPNQRIRILYDKHGAEISFTTKMYENMYGHVKAASNGGV